MLNTNRAKADFLLCSLNSFNNNRLSHYNKHVCQQTHYCAASSSTVAHPDYFVAHMLLGNVLQLTVCTVCNWFWRGRIYKYNILQRRSTSICFMLDFTLKGRKINWPLWSESIVNMSTWKDCHKAQNCGLVWALNAWMRSVYLLCCMWNLPSPRWDYPPRNLWSITQCCVG